MQVITTHAPHPFRLALQKLRGIGILLIAIASTNGGWSAEPGKTKHFGYSIQWLHFDYPADFVMDPKSHEGEAKYLAWFRSPDGSLKIEANSLGINDEQVAKIFGTKTPAESARSFAGEKARRTKHPGYDRFIEVKPDSVSVVFIRRPAKWGRCYQRLNFSFPEGSYERHREVIQKIIDSAYPSWAPYEEHEKRRRQREREAGRE